MPAGSLQNHLPGALTRWAAAVQAAAGWIIAGFALATAASAWVAATHLEINADTTELLSESLPWRQRQIALEQAFGDREDQILAVVQARTAIEAGAVRRALVDALADAPEVLAIEAPGSEDFFRHNAWLLMDQGKLVALSDDLIAAQPFLGRLNQNPSLTGLADLLTQLLTADDDLREALDVQTTLARFASVIQAQASGEQARLDWEALLSEPRQPRALLLIRPAGPTSGLKAIPAMQAIRAAAAPLIGDGISVRLTGQIPLRIDELTAARNGAALAGGLSLLAVTVVLMIGLRSAWLTLASLMALVSGLTVTAGFAALAVGRLNLISVAFSALYIGLAIDYAVHLCARYRELLRGGVDKTEALRSAVADVGGSLLLCMLTTSSAFFAFLPTAYDGVAELGLIAGTGIIIGLVTSLTLLPALIHRFPAPTESPQTAAALRRSHRAMPRRWVLLGAAVLAVAAAAALPSLRFDYNPVHLKPLHTEATQTFRLLADGPDSPLRIQVLANSADAAGALADQARGQSEVRRALWLGSFVPGDQDDKLALIDDLTLSLGGVLTAAPSLPALDTDGAQQARGALRALAAEARSAGNAPALATALDAWLANPAADVGQLQTALLGDYPALIDQLGDAARADRVTLATLPAWLREQWQAGAHWRVEVTAQANINNDAALKRFVHAVRSIAPHATGAPVTYLEAGRSVQQAFAVSFGLALAVIVVLLLILLRSAADTLRALTPLLLGTLLLGAAAAIIPIPLNFANIIALPLLLGIAIDNGIHVLWRARQDGAVFGTSTARAVLISAITTACSFGALALSAHRGMASMGLLLTLGLVLALLCTFVVLPALLPARDQRRTRAGAGGP